MVKLLGLAMGLGSALARVDSVMGPGQPDPQAQPTAADALSICKLYGADPLCETALPSDILQPASDGGGRDAGAACDEEWTEDQAAFEDDLLAELNGHRARGFACGGGPTLPAADALQSDEALRRAARCHSRYMAEVYSLDQYDAEGNLYLELPAREGYTGAIVGATLMFGIGSPAETADFVLSGDADFCADTMAADVVHAGIGASAPDAAGRRYLTLMYGK